LTASRIERNMFPDLNHRQEPTHAGMLIVADRGHLERLAGRLRRRLALSRWCVDLLVAFAIPATIRRRHRVLESCSGLGILVSAALLSGCGSIAYPLEHYEAMYTKTALETPAPDPAALSHLDAARVNRGRYLVDIAGCGGCHTDGALIGEPSAARLLAGSHLGIAYTNPFHGTFPGVAYPSNLTPDPQTGLGNWSDAQIAAAIRSGDLASGPGHLNVMSWPLYQHMSDDDVNAIVMYLRSIPAIEHQVPNRVAPGTRATTPYIYFGVFRSGPALGNQ
jgi:mono/diheme cytochrome c family protein